MTTTATQVTDTRGITSTNAPAAGRSPSRRTAWLLAGAAIVVVASGSVVAAVQLSDASSAPASEISHLSRTGTDPAGPSHGLGPARSSDADSSSVTASLTAHGTGGSLSDAAGRPLLP